MKLAFLKKDENRFKTYNYRLYDIVAYGERNDYPHSLIDVVNSSYTGGSCLSNYKKFIFGKGFADKKIYQMIVNSDGDTMDSILHGISEDLAMFGGFCLHLNFNMLGKITEIRYIPFENMRFCVSESKHDKQIALYYDWGLRRKKSIGINIDDIEYIDAFGEFNFRQRIQEVGGIQNYKGQIYYYSNKGKWNYPLPIYDNVLTDMNTQEAISNITNRNAKNGFLPSTMFIDIISGATDTEEVEKTKRVLESLSGDINAAKIAYMAVNSKEEIPEILKADVANYDKEFSVSREAAKEAIGQSFNQPPILRAEETGSNFGADLMRQAYMYYNSVTSDERLIIERELSKLMAMWVTPIELNMQIEPLTYGAETLKDRIGESRTEIIEIINSTATPERKKAILTTIYGLTEDEANKLLV